MKEKKNNQNNPVMKRSFVPLISLLLISCLMLSAKAPSADTLRIAASPDVSTIASAWAAGFNNSNQGLKVKVMVQSANSTSEDFLKSGMLGIVSSGSLKSTGNMEAWQTILGRDVIVPVMNINNPAREEIMKCGLSAGMLIDIVNGKKVNLASDPAETIPARYYYIEGNSIKGPVASFLGTENLHQSGAGVANVESLLSAIKKDPAAIAFCNLAIVADLEKQVMNEGLAILPIDRNDNGILDASENIYTDLNQFMRGVWIGKYPRSLSTSIYAAATEQPESEAARAFLKWVLADGQKLLFENGYSELLLAERQKSVDRINEAKVYSAAATESRSPVVVLLILAVAAIAVVLLVDIFVRYAKRLRIQSYEPIAESDKAFNEEGVNVPKGIYFDKAHTWAFMEQDGMVKVGIDDFLQHVTGTITKVQMKKEGTKVQKGEQILSIIQNGKHLDIYAPVSGTIMEHNAVLETNSGLINSSPYNEGWIYRIEPTNWFRENQLLFYADKYRQYLTQEFIRLKDFMATVLAAHDGEFSHAVLQDGGEFRDGLLAQMGPEVWDDFQTKYIDPSRQIWFYELF
jgi:glycine cleavage system H lipoate-binding protein/ABC-type phosphate transport system substrate-binding protein